MNKKTRNVLDGLNAFTACKVVSFGLILLGMVAVMWGTAMFERNVAPMPSSAMEAEYQRLLHAEDSIGGNWLRTLNPNMKTVQGDLVWNTTEQRGVMRIMHLPKPDRAQHYVVRAYDSYHTSSQGVPVAYLVEGAKEAPLFMNLQTQTRITDPYKFVLTQEPIQGQGDKQILLMVQL